MNSTQIITSLVLATILVAPTAKAGTRDGVGDGNPMAIRCANAGGLYVSGIDDIACVFGAAVVGGEFPTIGTTHMTRAEAEFFNRAKNVAQERANAARGKACKIVEEKFGHKYDVYPYATWPEPIAYCRCLGGTLGYIAKYNEDLLSDKTSAYQLCKFSDVSSIGIQTLDKGSEDPSNKQLADALRKVFPR